MSIPERKYSDTNEIIHTLLNQDPVKKRVRKTRTSNGPYRQTKRQVEYGCGDSRVFATSIAPKVGDELICPQCELWTNVIALGDVYSLVEDKPDTLF